MPTQNDPGGRVRDILEALKGDTLEDVDRLVGQLQRQLHKTRTALSDMTDHAQAAETALATERFAHERTRMELDSTNHECDALRDRVETLMKRAD